MHSHTFVSGPRSNGMFIKERQETTSTFHHSHEGGEIAHTHPNTGPAKYTIDKDEWFRATGGGRKKYTAKPTGEQMPMIPRSKEESSFEVIIVGDPQPKLGNGPGIALPERIAQNFNIGYTVRDERKRRA